MTFSTLRSLVSSSLFLLSVAACGNEVTSPTGSGGSGGGGGFGGGEACVPFLDDPSPATVTFRVRNDSSFDVYLLTHCGNPDFELHRTDPASPYEPIYDTRDSVCLQTCEELQHEAFDNGCDPCPPSSIRVAPGATYDILWDGRGLAHSTMLSGCYAYYASTFCPQFVAAEAGTYEISMYGSQDCGPDCTCDAQGICSGAPDALSGLSIPVTFSFPDETLAEVVFDACVFGCP